MTGRKNSSNQEVEGSNPSGLTIIVKEFHSVFMIIRSSEIKKRQEIALNLNKKIVRIIKSDSQLKKLIKVWLWHSSLVTGEGGEKYDIDLAAFVDVKKYSKLFKKAIWISERISSKLNLKNKDDPYFVADVLGPRRTIGIHWEHEDVPHIGIHFYTFNDLKYNVQCLKRLHKCKMSDFNEIFVRTIIIEAIPFVDSEGIFSEAKGLSEHLPKIIKEERIDNCIALLETFLYKSKDRWSISKLPTYKKLQIDRILIPAIYSINNVYQGTEKRFKTDLKKFRGRLSKDLIEFTFKKRTTKLASKILLQLKEYKI